MFCRYQKVEDEDRRHTCIVIRNKMNGELLKVQRIMVTVLNEHTGVDNKGKHTTKCVQEDNTHSLNMWDGLDRLLDWCVPSWGFVLPFS
jgi:hypothetical protein